MAVRASRRAWAASKRASSTLRRCVTLVTMRSETGAALTTGAPFLRLRLPLEAGFLRANHVPEQGPTAHGSVAGRMFGACDHSFSCYGTRRGATRRGYTSRADASVQIAFITLASLCRECENC